MFIAHLPAGYLVSHALRNLTNRTERAALMVGSILPDLDILRFYFIDAQSVHHHDYFTHRPIFWALVCAVGTIGWRCRFARALAALALGAMLHLMLDTHIGAINWGWPFLDLVGPLVTVPASRSHWILSFLTHWTFAIELAICTVAFAVWCATSKRKNPGQ